MLDITKTNFEKLESRVLAINDPKLVSANENNIRELLYLLSIEIKPTLIVATGGSKVVAHYLKQVLERIGYNGVLCEVIEPRDYFYKYNRGTFSNLVAISASGTTNGIKEILESFDGNRYLISENPQNGNYTTYTWGNELYDSEKSFISLASSLGPITHMLDTTNSDMLKFGFTDSEIAKINERIKKLLDISREKIENFPFDFKDSNLIQIISGYDTKPSEVALESNLVETGISSVVSHDKGSYCHGRSTLLYKNPESPIIYLKHRDTELDSKLISAISDTYPNFFLFDTKDLEEDYFWKEYYLLLQMYYLSKKIAEDKDEELTKPEKDKSFIKQFYNFRGEM